MTFTRSAITPPQANGFGWNLGHSEYIVWCWPWQILSAICAEARAGEGAELFCLVSNARFHGLPFGQISRNLHTRRGSERWRILSENIFENLPVRGLFSQKRSTFAWTSSTTSDFRPRYLRNDYKSSKVTTGWRAYGMLAFHLYRWNHLKVIPMACRTRTRSVLSNARSRVIYILKKFNSRTLKNLTAE